MTASSTTYDNIVLIEILIYEDVTTLVPLLNNKYQKTGLELKKKG
jgi:hypothetical protein